MTPICYTIRATVRFWSVMMEPEQPNISHGLNIHSLRFAADLFYKKSHSQILKNVDEAKATKYKSEPNKHF